MFKPLFINAGRVLMLGVWAILVLNLLQPFPRPLNHFMQIAMLFMALMHGLQLLMYKTTRPKTAPKLTAWQQMRIFAFGVFELLAEQRKPNV